MDKAVRLIRLITMVSQAVLEKENSLFKTLINIMDKFENSSYILPMPYTLGRLTVEKNTEWNQYESIHMYLFSSSLYW